MSLLNSIFESLLMKVLLDVSVHLKFCNLCFRDLKVVSEIRVCRDASVAKHSLRKPDAYRRL